MIQSQSDSQIASYALTLLKRPPISSISATTPDAVACSTVFPLLRDELLSVYAFTFSVKRARLQLLASRPIDQYLYAFAIPEDCLQPLELRGSMIYGTPSGAPEPGNCGPYPANDTSGVWPDEGYGWDLAEPFTWVVEGSSILTNACHLFLKYVSQVTETGLFSPLFSMALAYRIASTLAYSTTGNEKLAATLMQMSELYAKRAMAKDAQLGTDEPMPKTDSWLRSRGSSYFFNRGGGWRQGWTE